MNTEQETGHPSVHAIHMPAPTAWPFVLAIGVTFLFAGLVTAWPISVPWICADAVRLGRMVSQRISARAA